MPAESLTENAVSLDLRLSDVDPILKQAELLNIEIIWTPTDNIPDEATITIITNDPQNPTLEVPVTTP